MPFCINSDEIIFLEKSMKLNPTMMILFWAMLFIPTTLGRNMESVVRSCTGDLESDKADAIECVTRFTHCFKI